MPRTAPTRPRAPAIPGAAESSLSRRAIVLIAIVVLGGLLRLVGTFNDLWLDEIWSIRLAATAESAAHIFFELRHDNNHWLNTVWLYFTAQSESPTWMRLPAVLLGTAAVVLMAQIARSRGPTDAIFAAVLGALSYPLIHYSSEARGYAGAMCCGLLAAWSAGRFVDRPQPRWAALLWLSVVIGVMWHLTFIMVYAGIVLWTGWPLWQKTQRWRYAVAWAGLHGVSACALGIFYMSAVRGMTIGGGNRRDLLPVLAEALIKPLGATDGRDVQSIVVLTAAALAIYGVTCLARAGSQLWLLYSGVLLGGPLLTLAWRGIEYPHLRYFLVCVPFLLLLMSHALAELFTRTGWTRWTAITLLVLFIIGNAVHTRRFMYDGRGRYRQALRDMSDATAAAQVRVASDHDFRNRMVLEYFEPLVPGQKQLTYVDARSAASAEWVVMHRFELDLPAPATDGPLYQFAADGPLFRFVSIYRHGGLSGWTWLLFQRVQRPDDNPSDLSSSGP